jgi:hypothetical protein
VCGVYWSVSVVCVSVQESPFKKILSSHLSNCSAVLWLGGRADQKPFGPRLGAPVLLAVR